MLELPAASRNRFHYGLPGGRLRAYGRRCQRVQQHPLSAGLGGRRRAAVVLRGSKFAPGGSAWIWVDGVQGTKAAAAPVGPLGNFQASFTMPMIMAGKHNLVAIELKPGVKLPPRLRARCR